MHIKYVSIYYAIHMIQLVWVGLYVILIIGLHMYISYACKYIYV